MSPVAEPPNPQDSVAARAGVIASNDPTSHDLQATPLVASPAAPLPPVSVGALLRETREKLSLSPGDIATKLRMGLKQVVSLENSDYAALPTGTFLRGFVRNYAKAVALNADDVLALLEKTHSGAAVVKASSVVVPSQQNIKVPVPGGELATPSGRAFVIGVVVLLLLAALWYWWEYVFPHRSEGGRANAGATQTIAVPQPAQLAPVGAPATASAPVAGAPATLEGAAQNPLSEPSATAGVTSATGPISAPQPAPPPVVLSSVSAGAREAESVRVRAAVPPADGAALGFTFSGESWVEVVDGRGKTVLSRRFKAGDAEEVFGRAPLSVVIGNAKSTRMAFDGREFDLDPHTRGAVARVTVK